MDSYTYLTSTWAVPELRLDGGDEEPCFIMEDEAIQRWGEKLSGLKWPESALAILRGGEPATSPEDTQPE